jgi:hypothetical protein
MANSGPRARSETSKSVWLNVAVSVETLKAECPGRFVHLDSVTLGETKHSSRLVTPPLSAPNLTKKRAKWELERETGLEPATFSLEG